jgi:sulfopropanediol 3-dehydrogenase
MPKFLKQCANEQAAKDTDRQIRQAVEDIIYEIEAGGDAAVRRFSERFDHWSPPSFRLQPSEIDQILSSIPRQVIDDIRFAQEQVRRFAGEQRKALPDIEVETLPGVTLGHKHIPVDSVGCYVPGGHYPLVSSATMGIIPAKVAGVKRVVACTPPSQGKPPAASVAAMALAGADEIYILGGIQAVAALAVGTETIRPVDVIVGPGNAYVAEAKRQLYGRVGIDLFAGPSEVLVIADSSTDPEMAAADLLGQAEHGVNSPCILLTISEAVGQQTLKEIERQLLTLPTADIASAAWRDYGQVILASDDEEAVSIANQLAYEHVEVLTREPQYYLDHLKHYGSLFLGPETCVPYGDFAIGTNHTLPTRGAARYTGGLWVGKYLKTVTYQRCSPAASVRIGQYSSRLAELEGCFGHKAESDLRIRHYS